ncbi:unnamed protein product [Periconia digitata]|uniref:Zn(2)-C6 fungal-type domain-containing protein n=1 Tax=Periconia digitata TaxID=1303443 RepID=A0A9W4U144_9PLEO|nr:unnamed protein product [Periconia digitata]
MHEKKRRARTGCLTCRARRVKCDEQLPICKRCAAANTECAGYEQRRVIVCVNSPSNGQDINPAPARTPHQDPSPYSTVYMSDTAPSHLSHDRKPLISFPSSPRPSQNAGPGARHVLGYHQALLRTVPILFPTNHLHFWRDGLFQEAWGCEYLYLTLVALGNIHRAALMCDEREKANGLDMKITAVQLYVQALEDLEFHLEEAKQTPTLLVATLCLMAYFEALSGNIPAFIGRVQSAHHYFAAYLSKYSSMCGLENPHKEALDPLQDCFRCLGQTCYVALPLNRIHIIIEQYMATSQPGHREQDYRAFTVGEALQRLVGIISEDQQVKQLVWSPIATYARDTPIDAIRNVERKLREWKDCHLHLIPELDTDTALNTLLVYKWQSTPMPPPPYTITTRHSSVAAVHFNFYVARMKFALSSLGEDPENNQSTANFYFYEALRHAASHISRFSVASGIEDPYIPCESLNIGVLSVLHIIGLCSPQPSWLEWIKNSCDMIKQEGVIKGHTFATNLACLHAFEESRHGASLSIADRYPTPAERIICQLVPETDGRHFISYFAAPAGNLGTHHEGLSTYHVIGHARWACGGDESPCTPFIKMYGEEDVLLAPFSTDWLYSTQAVRDWTLWSQEKEFRMNRALQDHISGTRLLLAAGETTQRTDLLTR